VEGRRKGVERVRRESGRSCKELKVHCTVVGIGIG
jgi:hypothetical protein